MRFPTLEQWLDWQETLHPSGMKLGLARVRAVVSRLEWSDRPFPVITVAGTNGKGSTVAILESILGAAGYRTGVYTSPHLVRYNERIRIGRREADDGSIVASFDRLDRTRGELLLTYFEFGTLAAVDLFRRAGVDVAVLEVGIGGRLDAVNVFDPDVSVITPIDIDHVKWLGPDRESIAREKAGVLRTGVPAIVSDREPPSSLLARARELGAPLYRLGEEFAALPSGAGWRWRGPGETIESLPRPSLFGEFQLDNAAAALMAVRCLPARPVDRDAMCAGLLDIGLRGRYERLGGSPLRILDTAHNPHAARSLASSLAADPCAGRTLAVVGMLGDKDHLGVLGALGGEVDAWYVGSLGGPRGMSSAALAEVVRVVGGGPVACYPSVAEAHAAAARAAGAEDRVVIFGSFHTVGEVLAGWERGGSGSVPL